MTPPAASLTARMLGAVLAFELTKDMIAQGLWMLQPETMVGRIARLSSSPDAFAYLWMALALFVAPYLILQVTGYGRAHQTVITRLACWAILVSGVFWVYLGYLSRALDYAHITQVFMLHAVTCVAMAFILAHGLNSAQRAAEAYP